jgi:hypothetical protein
MSRPAGEHWSNAGQILVKRWSNTAALVREVTQASIPLSVMNVSVMTLSVTSQASIPEIFDCGGDRLPWHEAVAAPAATDMNTCMSNAAVHLFDKLIAHRARQMLLPTSFTLL